MNKKTGYLEVIAGPMFSGKTEELIRQLKRATYGKKRIQVFKHKIDTRYGSDEKLYSHAGLTFSSELIDHAGDILKFLDDKSHIIAIDEIQWFGSEVIFVIEKLLDQGLTVIVSGLALTYDRQPFEPIPSLMAIADKVTKLTALCALCGSEAPFHKRIAGKKSKINPLEADPALVSFSEYQPRCRKCFGKK